MLVSDLLLGVPVVDRFAGVRECAKVLGDLRAVHRELFRCRVQVVVRVGVRLGHCHHGVGDDELLESVCFALLIDFFNEFHRGDHVVDGGGVSGSAVGDEVFVLRVVKRFHGGLGTCPLEKSVGPPTALGLCRVIRGLTIGDFLLQCDDLGIRCLEFFLGVGFRETGNEEDADQKDCSRDGCKQFLEMTFFHEVLLSFSPLNNIISFSTNDKSKCL